MNSEEGDLRRRVLGEWAAFLQEELPGMRRFAEWKGRAYGLASGCGEDLVGEMTTTLVAKWEQLAVIVDDEARRKYAYGVLKKMLFKAMDRERRPPRVPLPAEDLLAAEVHRIGDVADQYVTGEAGGPTARWCRNSRPNSGS